MNLPTVEELDAWESLPKLYDGTARIPSDGDRERFSETAYHLWPRLIRAARLAVEGQERAKIVNKVLWEISAAKDFSELASKLDLTRSEYWQARCDALDDLRPAIASLAHLDEKPEPTESEAGK